jgi:hypothetical protein
MRGSGLLRRKVTHRVNFSNGESGNLSSAKPAVIAGHRRPVATEDKPKT